MNLSEKPLTRIISFRGYIEKEETTYHVLNFDFIRVARGGGPRDFRFSSRISFISTGIFFLSRILFL